MLKSMQKLLKLAKLIQNFLQARTKSPSLKIENSINSKRYKIFQIRKIFFLSTIYLNLNCDYILFFFFTNIHFTEP